ncbi:hypothetical protein E3N88_41691 [Mikania micrantha]|uniref:Uncharacterized protein n=1 Tax=Mikania micrantha TaxID=192012 RepID=A0A5N6LJX2_9ASTR|nr:hypothetical protein E3N88_41691 [Mikania micrantha]
MEIKSGCDQLERKTERKEREVRYCGLKFGVKYLLYKCKGWCWFGVTRVTRVVTERMCFQKRVQIREGEMRAWSGQHLDSCMSPERIEYHWSLGCHCGRGAEIWRVQVDERWSIEWNHEFARMIHISTIC